MNARSWLATGLALWLGCAALGCGRYGPPRRSGERPSAGPPAESPRSPDSDDEQRSRRAPRR